MTEIAEARNSPQYAATNDIPDLTTMTPAQAMSVWAKWNADNGPLDDEIHNNGVRVTLAIQEWRMNFGKTNENIARNNLSERLANFKASLDH